MKLQKIACNVSKYSSITAYLAHSIYEDITDAKKKRKR
jgi:hypothetical protein